MLQSLRKWSNLVIILLVCNTHTYVASITHFLSNKVFQIYLYFAPPFLTFLYCSWGTFNSIVKFLVKKPFPFVENFFFLSPFILFHYGALFALGRRYLTTLNCHMGHCCLCQLPENHLLCDSALLFRPTPPPTILLFVLKDFLVLSYTLSVFLLHVTCYFNRLMPSTKYNNLLFFIISSRSNSWFFMLQAILISTSTMVDLFMFHWFNCNCICILFIIIKRYILCLL